MKLYVLLLLATLFLFGCTEETVKEDSSVEDVTVSKDLESEEEKPSEEVKVEIEEKETEVTEVEPEPEPTTIKKEQIESMFTRDPDEKAYENSTFITKSDGQLTADYIMYVGDEDIPYLNAIFYGGDLADISFETQLSNDELEKLLGIKFSEEVRKGISRKNAYVTINFDKRFADENIERFPFELN